MALVALRARSPEVVETILASIRLAPADALDHDHQYLASREAAIKAVIRYGLDAIEHGGDEWQPIPQALVDHAHRAGRVGVRLGVLVRHYMTGHRRFMAVVEKEIEATGYYDRDGVLRYMRERYRQLDDHIVSSLEREHEWAAHHIAWLPEQRRKKLLVQRLLLEPLPPTELRELDYDVHNSWHIAIVAVGADGAEALHQLPVPHGRRLLSVPGDDGSTWLAWFGGEAQPTIAELMNRLLDRRRATPPWAIGEPRYGLPGWRQTYEEGRLATPIARRQCGLVRCAEVLPVVAAAESKAIIGAYQRTYLMPLNDLPKGGQPTREALRAYFKHDRTATAAANGANLSRKTIENHVHHARDVLGDLNLTALEIALLLEKLGYMDDD